MVNIANTFRAEIIKIKSDYRYYWFNYLTTYVNFVILITGIFFITIPKTHIYSAHHFYGFIFTVMLWYFGYSIVSAFSSIITEEILLGTINQLMASATQLYVILTIRQLIHIATIFFFILFSSSIILLLAPISVQFEFSWRDILIICSLFGITAVGLFGISLFVASLAFKFKKVTALGNIVNYIFLFFTGGFFALSLLPSWVVKVAHLIPLTLANDIFQQINNGEIIAANVERKVIHLVLLSMAYFIGGLLMFNFMYKKRKFGR